MCIGLYLEWFLMYSNAREFANQLMLYSRTLIWQCVRSRTRFWNCITDRALTIEHALNSNVTHIQFATTTTCAIFGHIRCCKHRAAVGEPSRNWATEQEVAASVAVAQFYGYSRISTLMEIFCTVI